MCHISVINWLHHYAIVNLVNQLEGNMKASTVDIERFMMHTELYLLLTGKDARELTRNDMDKVSEHMELQEESNSKLSIVSYN